MGKRYRKVCAPILFVSMLCCPLGLSSCAVTGASGMNHSMTSNENSQPKFSCVSTGEDWHGAPIFALSSSSDQMLKQLTISSWSGQFLPVLWVGRHLPQNIKLIAQSAAPPYTMPASSVVWFVGPTDSLVHHEPFTISWLVGGLSHYENVTASLSAS